MSFFFLMNVMERERCSFFLKVLVASLFLLTPIASQGAGDSIKKFMSMSLTELMEVSVVTPTKSAQKVSDAPGTIQVITKQQIRERGYVNLVDLLEGLPGVDVQRNAPSTYAQITTRGVSGSNNLIIMQNGIRINSPTEDIIPIHNNFPLFHVKRVEVIYGPASSLYGADAFAGVINIITEDAGEIDGVEVSSAIGSYSYYYDYLNFGKKVTDKLDVTFGGHWQDAQNPDLSKSWEGAFQKKPLLGSGGRVLVSAENREPFAAPSNSYSAYAKVDYDNRFTAGMTRSYLSSPTTAGLKPEQAKFGSDAVAEIQIDTWYGKYKENINSNLTGVSTFNYSMYETLPDTKYTNFAPDFSAYKYAQSERVEFEQQMDYKINETHSLVGGFVFDHYNSIPRTSDLPSPYNTSLGPQQQNFFFPSTNTSVRIPIFDLHYDNYAGYVQVQSKWSSMVTTFAGVRYDYSTRYDDAVNPRVGVIVKPVDSTVVKLLYGESYLAPAPERAFRFFGSFTGRTNAQGQYIANFFNLPNPDLKPEKLRSTDLSITHNVTRNFVVGASAFYSVISDSQTLVTQNRPSSFIEGAQILNYTRFENFGERIMFGGELRADYQVTLDRTNMKFWGNYSWVDGHEDLPRGGTGPLGLTARNKVKGGVTARYAEKYFVTPSIEWIDKTSNFSSTTAAKTPSYAVANLHAGVDNIYRGLSAFIDIRNLTDERYFNTAPLFQSFIFTPQNPRTFVGGLNYKF